jgi:hypothetical protein
MNQGWKRKIMNPALHAKREGKKEGTEWMQVVKGSGKCSHFPPPWELPEPHKQTPEAVNQT